MARSKMPAGQPALFALASGMAIVAILYFAREVLLPFALALLLSFLLAPLVDRLKRWHIARVPAVIMAVLLSFTFIGILGYVLFQQVYDLAYRLPDYETNITERVRALRGDEEGIFAKVATAVDDIQRKLREEPANPAVGPRGSSEAQSPPPTTNLERAPRRLASAPVLGGLARTDPPVRVQVVSPLSAAGFVEQLMAAGPWLAPLGTAIMVIVLTIFMLIEREDLRNRLIYLIGSHHLNDTTIALDAAAYRVSRYLRMQLVVNAIFGIAITIGLFAIGIPNSLLWGFAAILLRFIPFVGAVIAAIVPLAISLAVSSGWSAPVSVLVLYTVSEVVVGNVIEPRLIASSTGISALGILVSTIVWLWLWGPIGLILATPVTVCLAVLVGYVPRLEFLRTLLSDEHVLPPAARFYQRLLATDPDEALEVAEEYLRANSIESLYDVVLVPALRLAEEDHHQGALEESKHRFVHQIIRELVEDLGARETHPTAASAEASANDPGIREEQPGPTSALCLPASDDADELVGSMLAQMLAKHGIRMEVLSTAHLASEMVQEVVSRQVDVVCVSALPPVAATHARYICKRLLPKNQSFKVVCGLWQSEGAKKAQDRLLETGIAGCVTTLVNATELISSLVASARLLHNNPSAEPMGVVPSPAEVL